MAVLQASLKCSHTIVYVPLFVDLRLALEPNLRFSKHFYRFKRHKK
jgi:hypothetical protein